MYFSHENSDETKFSKEITTETGALEYLSSECAAMRPFKCVGYSGQPLQGKALFDQFYAIARRAIVQLLHFTIRQEHKLHYPI